MQVLMGGGGGGGGETSDFPVFVSEVLWDSTSPHVIWRHGTSLEEVVTPEMRNTQWPRQYVTVFPRSQ